MALGKSPVEIVASGEYPLLQTAPHWERIPLEEIAMVQNGFAFISKHFTHDAGMPLIRIRDVRRDFTENFYEGEFEDEYVVRKGDLLIGMDGDFYAANWKGPDGLLNQRVCRLVQKTELYSPGFLFLVLQPYLNAINAETSSVTVKHLSSRTISEIPLPLPPLAEQKRIVAKIEELFSELDAGEESLRRARRQLGVYRQSLLKQAFEGKLTAPWRAQHPDLLAPPDDLLARIQQKFPERPVIEEIPSSWIPCYLGEFVSIERGRFSVRPRNDPRYYGGDIPFVQIGDLPREGGSICTFKQTLNSEGLRVSKMFRKGTPLVAIVGATIGNTGILSFESCCPDSLVALVTDEPTIAGFVELYFRANKERIRNDSNASGGQPNINNAYLERQLIGVPSLSEQQEIVRLLDEQFEAIAHNELEIDAALKRSEALRRSILKKAFTGQLVLQDPADEPASALLERIRKERDAAPLAKRARGPRPTSV